MACVFTPEIFKKRNKGVFGYGFGKFFLFKDNEIIKIEKRICLILKIKNNF